MKNLAFLLTITLFLISCSDDNGPLNVGDPNLIVYSLSFDEADEDVDYTYYLRLGGNNSGGIPVNYRTISVSASAADFVEIEDAQVTFEPGETMLPITLTIKGDIEEEEKEKFKIEFTSPFADFSDVEVTITINDDDKVDNSGVLNIPSSGYITPESYPGMDLVWSDEFDEGELDLTSWSHRTGTGCPNLCGWGNAELQYYQPDNLYFEEDEYLIIQARRELVDASNYTSSRINTKDKQEFQYGRVDIRAAIPKGKGLWPALWMLGSNIDTNPWPACGEIDIMELNGSDPSTVYGTVHFGSSYPERMENGTTTTLSSGTFYDDFHVFSIIWEEDFIQILLDDEVYHTFSAGQTGDQPYPFNQPFYFVLNVAVGGTFPGSPDAETVLPQYMIVDYIRLFQDT